MTDRKQELLRRVDQLTADYHQEALDHARESHFNRDVQRREMELQDELRKYKSVMVGFASNKYGLTEAGWKKELIKDRTVMPSFSC